MKFKISRASIDAADYPDGLPTPGAVTIEEPRKREHTSFGKTRLNLHGGDWEIEVADLDALLELSRTVGHELIIAARRDSPEIMIYDDHVE